MHYASDNFTVRAHKFVYNSRIPVEWASSTLLLCVFTIAHGYMIGYIDHRDAKVGAS
jgi:hypothetical protein